MEELNLSIADQLIWECIVCFKFKWDYYFEKIRAQFTIASLPDVFYSFLVFTAHFNGTSMASMLFLSP
jgi:hypothetical protein